MSPGRIKISKALKALLKEKSFDTIKWREIAKTADVSEALIYKYFNSKRNLLLEVLNEYMCDYLKVLCQQLEGVEGAFNKLKVVVHSTLSAYRESEVLAKILIVEVRSDPGYFTSESYEEVQKYSGILLDIIDEGIRLGEIRDDIPPSHIRQMIMGVIEYMSLSMVFFKKIIDPEVYTDEICKIIFSGIRKQDSK